jgi:ABC-type dipeptide/oligopeptide/nickel transport system ATPase component
MKPRHIDRDIDPFLRIDNLSISASKGGEPIPLVHNVDLAVWPGERVALVGESGSGKTVTARSILQLDRQLDCTGSITLGGNDILGATADKLRQVRGHVAAMVFQDPMTALNPVLTIGDQITEPLRASGEPRRGARRRAEEMLDLLGVPEPRLKMRSYPAELSGGMRQRVLLAIALVCQPTLLIADEPTTALDTRVQQQVLDLVVQLSDELRFAVLLITHDLGVVAGATDRVYVMREGVVVDSALVDNLFATPTHPYTRQLLAAIPTIDHDPDVPLAMAGSRVPPRGV